MDPIRILVNAPLFEETVPRIAAVSPRVQVTHIASLMKAERDGDPAASRQLDALLSVAEVVAGMRLPDRLLQRAPHLRWVQLTSAGVDHILDDALRNSHVVLTNASNLHSFAIAEFALTSCLALAKNVRECYRQKDARLWEPYNPVILRARRWASWASAISAEGWRAWPPPSRCASLAFAGRSRSPEPPGTPRRCSPPPRLTGCWRRVTLSSSRSH